MARPRRGAAPAGDAASRFWGLTLVLAEIAERLERERADDPADRRRRADDDAPERPL